MMDDNTFCLRMDHVTKSFKTRNDTITAIDDITLNNVSHGEFICFLGPSGCGKTTLLRMIAGLEIPTSGSIIIEGKTVTGPSPKMTMVFQEYSLYPWLTIEQNVEFGLVMNKTPKDQRVNIVKNQLKLVGLENFGDRYPYELSGGMRQRAAVARSLATDPSVLLMDEPFGALDSQTRNKMQNELLNIWDKTKKTILFVTHSIDEAIYLSDKIVIMTPRPGKIHDIYDVSLPRPRDRSSVDFAQLRKKILSVIEKLE